MERVRPRLKVVETATVPEKPDKTRPQMSFEEHQVLRTILGQEPVYEDLPLNTLGIDYAYQDRPRKQLVQQIARDFSPVMLGILIVSRRPNGSLWVCDGATRKLALEKRGDATRIVRCQVIATDGLKQEALLFKHYNSERKTVPLANRLNAEGIAGVDRGFCKIVERCGFKLTGTGKKVLKGAGFALQAFKLDDGKSLEKALFVLKAAWRDKYRIDGHNVLGVAVLFSSQRHSVEAQVRKVLNRNGPDELEVIIRRLWGGGPKVTAKLHPHDRPRFVARALGQLINKHPGKNSKVDLSRIDWGEAA